MHEQHPTLGTYIYPERDFLALWHAAPASSVAHGVDCIILAEI